ncbi:MAG: serine/threonine protein kinase [Anaerolineae bacterium]|nr:serine/threonine protein kinase [Anaerolineae bacterium]
MSIQVGQMLKGRYRIQAILGEGGMGTVYLAQDTLLDRPRAIKELYSDPLADEAKLIAARTQFEREAKALSELRHKNLPHVNDYFSIDENDYLVMDYIQGESLADILGRKKRPTEPLLCIWLDQILDALAYCHQHNVIHRDIKPANIVLTPEGKVMLVDFGLVKFIDPHNPRTATIVHGLGTPDYTPLEQYDASIGHTDGRSDIYSLGATMYHLLTGRKPQPVSGRILKPDTQPDISELNPKVSPWMIAFVRKSMAIRPENRYQSVVDMRQELQTRVFKVKSASRGRAAPRASTASTARKPAPGSAPHRAPAQESRQYRYGKSSPRPKTNPSRSSPGLPQIDKKMATELLPMAVPIGIVTFLTVFTILAFASSSFVTAAIMIAPLILGGLAYNKFSSRKHRGPPRF